MRMRYAAVMMMVVMVVVMIMAVVVMLLAHALSSRMRAAIRSPTIMVGRLVLAQGTLGKIEASQTRNPSTPITLPFASTNCHGIVPASHAIGAGDVPMAEHRIPDPGFAGFVVVHQVVHRWRGRSCI